MMRQVLSSGVCEITFANSSPSIPGIRASSSTSANGSLDATPRQSALRAAGTSAVAVGIIPHALAHPWRMVRFVALSSTIRTRSSCRSTTGGWAGAAARCEERPKRRRSERAAATDLALDRNRSAHHSDQARRDRESQAGPTITTGRRAVRLLECSENRLLLLGRDANACIHNFLNHHRRWSVSCVRE
jgi:hypothetical protein